MKTIFLKNDNIYQLYKAGLLKLIWVIFFSVIIESSQAQNLEKEEYMIATISGSYYNIQVYIDYNPDNIQRRIKAEKDSTGEVILFASTSAALNYIVQKGWLLLYPLPTNEYTKGNEYNFIFRRSKNVKLDAGK